MHLQHYAILIKKRAWFILLGVILCVGATATVTSIKRPVFEATATIEVADQGTDVFGNQANAVAYALQVTDADVLQKAANQLSGVSVDTLENAINAFPIDNTQLIAVQADASTPQQAVTFANAVAQAFIQQKLASEMTRLQSSASQLSKQLAVAKANMDQAEQNLTQLQQNNASAAQIQQANDQLATDQSTYDSLSASYDNIETQETQLNSSLVLDQLATLPTGPVGMSKTMALGIALALSLLLMLLLVLLLDWLDVTLKTSEDITQLARLEPLGSIPARSSKLPALIPASEASDESVEQAFTVISAHFHALYRGQRALLVTGLHRGNGASTTASNLALALAQSGMRVLLIDANLRRPVQHEIFHVVNTRGLTNSLVSSQSTEISAWLQMWTTQVPNLWLLPAGPASASPLAVLRAPELQKLVRRLLLGTEEESGGGQKQVDIIIFDAPALLEEADATVLALLCDSALLVIEAARERKETLKRANTILQRLGTPVLGVVINRQKTTHRSYLYINQSSSEMSLEERNVAEPVVRYPLLRLSYQQTELIPLRTPSGVQQAYRRDERPAFQGNAARDLTKAPTVGLPDPVPQRPFAVKQPEEQRKR
jgi:succinoglycan biosynthesis transport protein ExoP